MIGLLLATIVLIVATSASLPACALTRTWISGHGTDQSGCGPVATPCRTLQYAHDNTSAGGEIDVLDSAGYGSVVVTKAISIVNDGNVAGVLAPAQGTGVTINAASADIIILRGLTIEGAGDAYNGVLFNSGGSLTVVNCAISGFVAASSSPTIVTSGTGILILPTTTTVAISASDTQIFGNAGYGFVYQGNANGVTATIALTRVGATGNANGILLGNKASTTGTTMANIVDSTASNNASAGYMFAGLGKLTVSLDNCVASNNGATAGTGNGIVATSAATTVYVGRGVVANNPTFGLSAVSGATINSYGNNQVDGNGTNVNGNVVTVATR